MTPGKVSRRKKAVSVTSETGPPPPEGGRGEPSEFPIVGIGASAGGLEAFELFFAHTLPDSGMAYVLVSHLDPNHVSMLTEILQRVTSMPMLEAQDNMRVARNSVYVIPPNRDMIFSNGTLKLSMPTMPHGYRMPIDFFLRSLAKEQGEKAIGIILSGTGSDGSLGLRDIHSVGGLSLVQDPQTAKFDGMPISAMESGHPTYVLSPDKMPEVLAGAMKQFSRRPAVMESEDNPAEIRLLKKILDLIHTSTGHDFSQYKKSTLTRRIARRMAQNNIDLTETYLRFLREFPEEIKVLDRELLINVTSFFRDPEAFSVLQEEVLPDLLRDKPDDYPFRIWIPACSTGEEAYSFAILFEEFLEKTGRKLKVQIFATDLDDEAINQARTGKYLVNISQDLTPERLQRFFVKDRSDYRVKKGIRDMVIFAVHDITKDPPFTKLDLLSCRNLLIYLEPELQGRLMEMFSYSIKPGGVLVLSPSEGIGNSTDLFVPVNRKSKIFRVTHSIASTQGGLPSNDINWVLPSGEKRSEPAMKRGKEPNFAELIRRVLLQSYSPASVVTNLKGDILFFHGETGKYLELPSGPPTFNVIELACEGLQTEIRKAIEKAAKQNVPTLNLEIVVRKFGTIHPVRLSVRPLPDPDTDKILLLITFQDVLLPPSEKPGKGSRGEGTLQSRRIRDLEHALSMTRENLQETIEEQQAANEEVKSSNEELQSTNEELQSSNEELQTSKEEMHSINEELITVNGEFQEKIEQLSRIQNDMKTLLDNISVGIIYLDPQMVVRRFSNAATKIYRLIDSDVGRPLSDIKSSLPDDSLLADARTVADSHVACERELLTTDNTWFLVRIQPYRATDKEVMGVAMTFTDITARVEYDSEMKELELAQDIVNTVIEPVVVLDNALKVITASPSFYREFRLSMEETLGRPIGELGDQWKNETFKKLLEIVLPFDKSFNDYLMEETIPGVGIRKIMINGRRLLSKKTTGPMILLAMKICEPETEESR